MQKCQCGMSLPETCKEKTSVAFVRMNFTHQFLIQWCLSQICSQRLELISDNSSLCSMVLCGDESNEIKAKKPSGGGGQGMVWPARSCENRSNDLERMSISIQHIESQLLFKRSQRLLHLWQSRILCHIGHTKKRYQWQKQLSVAMALASSYSAKHRLPKVQNTALSRQLKSELSIKRLTYFNAMVPHIYWQNMGRTFKTGWLNA